MKQREPIDLIVTVDVEDYYMSPETIPVVSWRQYEDRIEVGMRRVMELLDKYEAKATFFVLGWVAERHPDLIAEVAACGHEIATHTYDHRQVRQLDSDDYRASLIDSLRILREISGQPVKGHRAPVFSLERTMHWAFELMVKNGITYDSSIYPVQTYLYGDRSAPRMPYRVGKDTMWEIPPSTVFWRGRKLPVGGGGFMRALPLTYIRWACRRVNTERSPAIVYVHPWEFDPKHPIPNVLRGKQRRIHVVGLRGMARKFERLLAVSKTRLMIDYVKELDERRSQRTAPERTNQDPTIMPLSSLGS